MYDSSFVFAFTSEVMATYFCENIFFSVQIIFSKKCVQLATSVIFQGTGKRITKQDIYAYDNIIKVYLKNMS